MFSPGHDANITAHIYMGRNFKPRTVQLHFGGKGIKKPFPNIWAQFPENLLQDPFHVTVLGVSHKLPRNQSYYFSPLQPYLMVRHLQELRHDEAGSFLQLNIFWASAIWQDYKDERGIVSALYVSLELREGKKSIYTWLSEDKVMSKSSKKEMIQLGVMVTFMLI